MKKGEKKMTTLTLNQISARIREDSYKKEQSIERFSANLKKKNLNKGRVRPKDPVEASILSRFLKK